jgi:hypothetical protein
MVLTTITRANSWAGVVPDVEVAGQTTGARFLTTQAYSMKNLRWEILTHVNSARLPRSYYRRIVHGFH